MGRRSLFFGFSWTRPRPRPRPLQLDRHGAQLLFGASGTVSAILGVLCLVAMPFAPLPCTIVGLAVCLVTTTSAVMYYRRADEPTSYDEPAA